MASSITVIASTYMVTRRHYCYPDHHIRWFVISKQRNLRFFDDRNVFIAISQPEMVKRLGVDDQIPYNNISKYELDKNEPL